MRPNPTGLHRSKQQSPQILIKRHKKSTSKYNYNKSVPQSEITTYTRIILTKSAYTMSIKIDKISCGPNFTILLDSAMMNLYSFGDNRYGQLGYGNCTQNMGQARPIQINNKNTNTQVRIDGIRCGYTHVVVFNQWECYGWGEHQFGALGYEAKQIIHPWMPRKLPILVSGHERLMDVSCGNNTTIFNISNDFYTLGDNRFGQLAQILRKPSFIPEKIQIQNMQWESSSYNKSTQASTHRSNSHNRNNKQQAKLIKVKSGDRFTVGLCQNGRVYGAGQFTKIGLKTRTNSMLPAGLCELEQHSMMHGYQPISEIADNIVDIECGDNLILKLENGQIIVYCSQRIHKMILPVKNKGDQNHNANTKMQITGHCRDKLIYKKQQKYYKWDIYGDVTQLGKEICGNRNIGNLYNGQSIIDKQIVLASCQGDGNIVYLPNYDGESELGNWEQQWKQDQPLQYEEMHSHRLYSNNAISHDQAYLQANMQTGQNYSTIKHTSTNQNSTDIENLHKEINQQKQIIRLYEQYVRKLQMENSQLKSKLKQSSKDEIRLQYEYSLEELDDNVSKGITMLKSMLTDMVVQHQSKFNLKPQNRQKAVYGHKIPKTNGYI